jgi:hypothetical protein
MTDTNGRLETWAAIEAFIFAGDATFTLVSLKTGVRFTYKVRVKKGDRRRLEEAEDLRRHAAEHGEPPDLEPSMTESDVTYFANLLRGPDNTADFAYMGVVRDKPPRFFWTQASGKVGRGAPAHKALLWMLDAMRCGRDVLGSSLEVWHEGRCGCCGRKLTVPDSIAAGLGPECARRAA